MDNKRVCINISACSFIFNSTQDKIQNIRIIQNFIHLLHLSNYSPIDAKLYFDFWHDTILRKVVDSIIKRCYVSRIGESE